MNKTFNFEVYAEDNNFFIRDIRKRILSDDEKYRLQNLLHSFMYDHAPDLEVMDTWYPRVNMYVKKYFSNDEWHWWTKAMVEMDKFYNVVRAY